MADGRWVEVATRGELREGDVVAVEVEGRELALYLVEGEVFATDNLCTHGNARLSEGFMLDHCVECPLHQGQFDVRTGEPLCEPVTEPVRSYPARFTGDAVEVDLAAAGD